MLRWIACGSFFLVFTIIAQAQEFSADVVNLKQTRTEMKKLYAGKDKFRFDVEGKSGTSGPSAFIVDEAQSKAIALMTERHMYMETPPMMSAPLILQFWRVSDVNDACTQWKKVAEQVKRGSKFGTCTKIGGDSVNVRTAVKYQSVSTDGQTSYVWVDTKLHCVVKTETPTGGMELRNIQEGSQSSSLFEVPAGYTKFDIGSMMQRPQ